jgi:phosphate:Na+ symporter
MGANIGTTLGNGLIALPLGPLGLLLAGLFALVYVFSKSDRVKNVAFASMGFSLIFFGLNLLTSGLRPLREVPEVMHAISGLAAGSFPGLLACVAIAALITALIHSSSATIGIVMGLGASGILSWETAVAFSLGADLGTTITSWMASLNLSKNAKRAAYAHIAFNFIGVLVMLPLFFPSMKLLAWAMNAFGGDPAAPVLQNGKEVFPLVPVAVGIYSTSFNIFNTLLLFPFVGTFERVLSKVGHSREDEREDYSIPRFLDQAAAAEFPSGVGRVHQELTRQAEAAAVFVDIAGRAAGAPKLKDHHTAVGILGRDIRRYTAALFQQAKEPGQAELLASLIEEAELTSTLVDALEQVARQGPALSSDAQALLDDAREGLGQAVRRLSEPAPSHDPLEAELREELLLRTRERCLTAALPWEERGVVLELLGAAKRTFFLVDAIRAERRSVSRELPYGRFAPSMPIAA